jgi:large subunit ribosomal protein L10e
MKGRNYRAPVGMPYVRTEYIAGNPGLKIAKFTTGSYSDFYNYKLELVADGVAQIRQNSLESCRLAANKTLASKIGETSFFSVLKVYPHIILRENKMIATAGADRLQEGMRRAFGKAVGRAARIKQGQTIIELYVKESDLELAKEALKVASSKLPIKTDIRITKIN